MTSRQLARRAGRSRLAPASRLLGFAGALSVAVLGWVAAPATAHADCDVTATGIPDDAAFKFDPGGVRRALARGGIGVGGMYLGEAFANSGGMHQGAEYDGVLWMYLNGDMKKLGLWQGLCFHADGYQIHGQSITADNIGSLMPVSNYEALASTRLSELWLEQHMFDDRLAVRIGQLTADTEFALSIGGGYFLNGTWGWSSLLASDMPSGGPAYPLATPGVRVAINPNEKWGLMIGVYNGDPAPACNADDPQRCNPHGLDFELDDPPLLMVESKYSHNPNGLSGTVKIGGWNNFGTFNHQRFDSGGALIAVTGNEGRPLDHDWGLYGIIDQLVWRVPGSEDPKGVGIFARVMGAPDDRNLVDVYFDGGVTFTGMLFRGRLDDALAIGFAYTNISNQVTAFDVDLGEPAPRNYEALVEICYTYQINGGWSVQPNFQYIWQPGGSSGVDDAAVVGARSSINF